MGFPGAGILPAVGTGQTSLRQRVAFSRLLGSLGRIKDREGGKFR